MPGKNRVFTTRVDPVSPPRVAAVGHALTGVSGVASIKLVRIRPFGFRRTVLLAALAKTGGGAGYRPRVRSVYSTWRLSP